MNIYEMELHDVIKVPTSNVKYFVGQDLKDKEVLVLRVEGGWIYIVSQSDSIFVPYSEALKEKKEERETLPTYKGEQFAMHEMPKSSYIEGLGYYSPEEFLYIKSKNLPAEIFQVPKQIFEEMISSGNIEIYFNEKIFGKYNHRLFFDKEWLFVDAAVAGKDETKNFLTKAIKLSHGLISITCEIFEDFESSNIELVGYDREASVLLIRFKGGTEYLYKDVASCIYEDMTHVESLGKYFNELIKGNYPVMKVTGLPDGMLSAWIYPEDKT